MSAGPDSDGAAAAEQTISVVADLRSGQRRFRLPGIDMLDAELIESQLRIYRQSDVQLSMQPPAGWMPQDETAASQYRRGLGRLVAALVEPWSYGRAEPTISRSPNRPQLSGKMFLQPVRWRLAVRGEP